MTDDAAITLELRKLVGMLLEKIAESPDKPRTLAWGDAGRRSRLVNAACRSWRRQESRTDVATDVLTRCRASQRKYRNTLLFVAADEAQLGTARESMRRSLAWASITSDTRLMQQQLTQGQAADAQEKAKNNREGARRACVGTSALVVARAIPRLCHHLPVPLPIG